MTPLCLQKIAKIHGGVSFQDKGDGLYEINGSLIDTLHPRLIEKTTFAVDPKTNIMSETVEIVPNPLYRGHVKMTGQNIACISAYCGTIMGLLICTL